MTQIGGGCCDCQTLKQDYLWEPKDCTIAKWDAKQFCSKVLSEKVGGLLGGRTRLRRLMIIGKLR